jgi:hypothetical protein
LYPAPRSIALIIALTLIHCDRERPTLRATPPAEPSTAAPGAAQEQRTETAKQRAPNPSPPVCRSYALPRKTGHIRSDALDEISGIAASRTVSDRFWVHNDSGEDKARLFVIDSSGRHHVTYRLKGVDGVDTEDIAIGPCGHPLAERRKSCIYLADIGDNDHERDWAVIYRVEEPDALVGEISSAGQPAKGKFKKREVVRLSFRYPAVKSASSALRRGMEHPNAEAMVVLADARIVILTKRARGGSGVYRFRPDPTRTVVAEHIGNLNLQLVRNDDTTGSPATAADLTDDGRWLLVRTYLTIFVFYVGDKLLAPAAEAMEGLANAPRTRVKEGFDLQGEAACWDRTAGLWHTSENLHPQVNVPIWRIDCK